MSLSRVLLLAMGGTIAMRADGDGGAAPRLDAEDLIAAVPGLAAVADVEASSFRRLPGAHLSFEDIGRLAERIDDALDEGFDGVVVTQGTDTIEETAFLLDLLVCGDGPVVMTGAMRNATAVGADGPANLLAAVRVAATPALRTLGVLVVISDEIHAARFVRKAHTQSTAAFVSLPGALGWVSEGQPRIVMAPVQRPRLEVAAYGPQRVALVSVGLDDDGALLDSVLESGYDGVVVEALGAGHVPAQFVPALARAAARMPVVLASRTRAGEVLRATYDFPGSESDLLARGAICAGWLDGPKARVLLTVLLRAGHDGAAVRAGFAQFLSLQVGAAA